MRSFKAVAVAIGQLPEVDTFALVMAENADGSGACLEIQRAGSFDDADRANGMDTYSIVTEAGRCRYGGVTGWSIAGGVLELSLEPEAATLLDAGAGFRVSFPEHLETELRQALRTLLLDASPAVLREIQRLVIDLAAGDFASIESDGRLGRLTQEELRRAISDYGRTLVALPPEGVDGIDVYRHTVDPRRMSVDVDMYTVEEGRSDLTLSLTVAEVGGGASVSIDDLHVL